MSGLCTTTFFSGVDGFAIRLDYINGFGLGVVQIARLLDWDFSAEADSIQWADTGSDGCAWTMTTVRKITGRLGFTYDINAPQHFRLTEGRGFGLLLCMGAAQSNDWILIPMAAILRIGYRCDVRGGDPVGGEAYFASSGNYRIVPSIFLGQGEIFNITGNLVDLSLLQESGNFIGLAGLMNHHTVASPVTRRTPA